MSIIYCLFPPTAGGLILRSLLVNGSHVFFRPCAAVCTSILGRNCSLYCSGQPVMIFIKPDNEITRCLVPLDMIPRPALFCYWAKRAFVHQILILGAKMLSASCPHVFIVHDYSSFLVVSNQQAYLLPRWRAYILSRPGAVRALVRGRFSLCRP